MVLTTLAAEKERNAAMVEWIFAVHNECRRVQPPADVWMAPTGRPSSLWRAGLRRRKSGRPGQQGHGLDESRSTVLAANGPMCGLMRG